MTQRDVSIPTPDGTCDASLHTPSGHGPWPAVIMYPDAGGVRPTFHAMAQRLADLGYAVLLPNLYYRHGEIAPFDMRTAFSDPSERNRLKSLVASVTNDIAVRDTEAMLDFLAGQPEVAGPEVGTTGYCMGGRISLLAAGHFPHRVVAAASFHGGHLATAKPNSPHLLAKAMKARLYVAAAENDASFDAEQAQRLSEALIQAGVEHKLETYPAAHGFAVPDNPSYDEAAEARHWHALEELFESALNDASSSDGN